MCASNSEMPERKERAEREEQPRAQFGDFCARCNYGYREGELLHYHKPVGRERKDK